MEKCRRVRSNLLLQDCFLRDSMQAKDLNSSFSEKKYSELHRITKDNGIVEELEEVPYPITPKTVKSYSSADYHVDPVGAILRGSSGKNIGDVSAIQKVMSMDSLEAAEYYAALKQRFQQASLKDSTPPVSAPTDAGSEGGDK